MKWLSALLLVVSAAFADDTGPMPRGVTHGFYSGWDNALTLQGGDTRLVVVLDVGGRPLHWSVNGENILYENRDAFGRTLANTPGGFSPGGAQCDIGPELRGIVAHPNLWIGPWMGRAPRDYVVHVFSPAEMSVGVQIDKEFTMDQETGELGLIQRMRNIITTGVSFCLWDRTLCKNGGYALLPLEKKSRFKERWSIRRGTAGHYEYDGERPSDRRVRVMDNVLVVQARELPDAAELKVGCDTSDGWIAYVREKTLFIKYFPVTAKANYSDGGNTLEFYCNQRVAELEPLSPEVRLEPGAEYRFPEKWVLVQLDKEVSTFEQARAVVKRIPKSPFK